MFLLANLTAPAVTGDDANILLYVILGLVAVAVVLLLTFKDKILKKAGLDRKGQKDADEQWAESGAAKAGPDGSAENGTKDSGKETKEQPEDGQ